MPLETPSNETDIVHGREANAEDLLREAQENSIKDQDIHARILLAQDSRPEPSQGAEVKMTTTLARHARRQLIP